ncbi:MobA/MobL family protein [Burkholderia cepacia]|uniref:MobA/MobL family protein n=1 Tax=Burkholderia cepacia TaxID=292 RepID=UPI000ACAAB34|nr:MobA/MobL family protein [Burkholderia cepacia]
MNRLERGEVLEATEAGNMPAWAEHDPQQFWLAADANERANGTTYREMEIALPRELTPEQRVDLVREFVRQEIGDHHAYQWAIHSPTAADGKEQPHVHLMFSERQRDGIERDPDQYFKRYNAKVPEKGGARKGYGPHAGQTLTHGERADDLKALRGRWQETANVHLHRAGHDARIDMRSYAERGLAMEPEAKQLPSQWRGDGRAKVLELRAARVNLRQARRELSALVPNVRAEVIDLEVARAQRRSNPEAPLVTAQTLRGQFEEHIDGQSAAVQGMARQMFERRVATLQRDAFERRIANKPLADQEKLRAAFNERLARQAGQSNDEKQSERKTQDPRRSGQNGKER